jgi:hypothetical protein
MKINATVFVDRLVGPFVDDALEQPTETPPQEQSRAAKPKGSQQAGRRRKKPETEPVLGVNYGPFTHGALDHATEKATHHRARKPKAKAPKKTVSRKKKPGSASTQSQRRKPKNGR